MPPLTKDDVLAALPKLSRTELSEVQAVVQHLLGVAVDEKPEETELFDVIRKAAGVGTGFTQGQVVLAVLSKPWQRNAPSVVQFIADTFPESKKHKVMRLALTQFAVGILVENLRAQGIPISIRSIVLNLQRVPQCFEEAFPDYAKTGLAYIIAEAMTHRNGD